MHACLIQVAVACLIEVATKTGFTVVGQRSIFSLICPFSLWEVA